MAPNSQLHLLRIASSLVRTLVSWTYLGLVTLVFAVLTIVLLPSRRLRMLVFNGFGHLTGRVMVFFAGATIPPGIPARLKASHPAIYVSNHTSYLDIFLGVWMGPFGTVGTAKKETVHVPFFGQLYAISGHVLVHRDDRRHAAAALRTIVDLMQRHRFGVLVWPEGTRSADGRLQPFKRGFAHLALATRLPIVPIVVSGAHRCWPKGSPFTQPARVDIQVLPPIPTTDWTAATLDRHVDEVWQKFAAALPADQQPLKRAA